jgi:hypothetical protein
MANQLPSVERINELLEYKDGELYWKAKPSKHSRNSRVFEKAGHLKKNKYSVIGIDGIVYPIHRIIYKMFNSDFDGFIDHIDGNPANNRIENLRVASPAQNQSNAKLRTDNTSGVKGVSFDKSKNKWKVRLQVNNKPILLGNFEDFEFAELVMVEARQKFHKEFANYGIN